jgi:hypothetical protein
MTDDRKHLDPGAYIGHEPELAADRIPGGVRPGDERVAATQSGSGVPPTPAPSGHREADGGDAERREAGQDR